jgi:hypothetical protein
MSRTFRRKNQQHDYEWVLIDWKSGGGVNHTLRLDPRSSLGRKALAHYHSDNEVTMGSSAPRWYRKAYDHRLRTRNNRQMRKWLAEPAFDLIFEASHRHNANYSWR